MNKLKVSYKIGNVHSFKVPHYKILINYKGGGDGKIHFTGEKPADTSLINDQSEHHQSWDKSKLCAT